MSLYYTGLNGWDHCNVCDKKFRGYDRSVYREKIDVHLHENHPQQLIEDAVASAAQGVKHLVDEAREQFEIRLVLANAVIQTNIGPAVFNHTLPESVISILEKQIMGWDYNYRRYPHGLFMAKAEADLTAAVQAFIDNGKPVSEWTRDHSREEELALFPADIEATRSQDEWYGVPVSA